MQLQWKISHDGTSVFRILDNGSGESKILSALNAAEFESALPADPIPIETVIADFVSKIQERLDDFARTRGYDNILSACTYASSLVPKFKSEGQYCVEARDATWSAAYALMAEVQAGARPMPMLDEVLAALPVLAWPL